MQNLLLCFRSQRLAGSKYYYFGLLDSEETLDFKHSRIWRPYIQEAFGDKDISHRVMTGSIEPSNIHGYPYEWSGVDDYWFSGNHQYNTWQCGTSFAWMRHHEYIPRYRSVTESAYEYRMVQDGDYLYVQMRTGSATYFGSEQYNLDLTYSNWTNIGAEKDLNTNTWLSFRGTWSIFNITYDITKPLPYYWTEYMDGEKRPLYNSNKYAGLLSDLIRDTICENTTYNTNNYANLIEIVDTIRDFRNGKIVDLVEDSKEFYKEAKAVLGDLANGKNIRSSMWKIGKGTSKTLSDGWLKYRYLYSTTKSDVEQYARAKFGEYLEHVTKERVFRGSADVDNGILRIKIRMHENPAPNFEQFLVNMDQYGLYPGLYNIWDLIPFSFIADWTSNLGDILQDIDQSIYFQYYIVDELLVSYKQEIDVQEIWGLTHYKWYDRYILSEWPQWEVYDDNEVAAKTVFKRALDIASLVVGIA